MATKSPYTLGKRMTREADYIPAIRDVIGKSRRVEVDTEGERFVGLAIEAAASPGTIVVDLGRRSGGRKTISTRSVLAARILPG